MANPFYPNDVQDIPDESASNKRVTQKGKIDFDSVVITDNLLHQRNEDGEESIVFPITRYANIMGRPQIVDDVSKIRGSDFVFLVSGEEEITAEEANAFYGKEIF